MIDQPIRQWIDPFLDVIAARLHRMGITANAVTVGGFISGVVACVAISQSFYTVGLSLILLNRLADGVDGCLARIRKPTDLGGFLDIVFDTLFYSAVPFAFALADPSRSLPACFLIFSFVGTGGSFLAFAVIAARRGVARDPEGKKSFFYSVGLMEGAETIVCFILICLMPHRFAALAWTFGSLCWLTTIIRIAAGVVAFREAAPEAMERIEPSAPSFVAHDEKTALSDERT